MPENVVSDSISRNIGREAQRSNILAVKLIAEIVRSTLGPKGMDKMIVDSVGNIIVTNDGATILREIELDHPAAKMVVDIAKTQELEEGDGTTSVAVFAGSLLAEAEKLLDKKIHPSHIIKGYNSALEHSKSLLEEQSIPVASKQDLKNALLTSMTGKSAELQRNHFADLIVNSADIISDKNNFLIENVKIIKVKSGEPIQSDLVPGLIIEKEPAHQAMPQEVLNARIALIDFPLELRAPETETSLSITSPEQLASFIESEEQAIRALAFRISSSGANVVFCQKGIDDIAQYYLAQAGILACRRVPKSDMQRLSLVTSGKIISSLAELHERNFGTASSVESVKLGEDQFTSIRADKPKAVTLILRGSSEHLVDEIERAIQDGLGVASSLIRNGKLVSGGGAIEIELARRLREFAKSQSGREQLAIESFASSLESIPEALAENAGLDQLSILTQLRKEHESGRPRAGINLSNEKIEDCFAAGIVEPAKVKLQALTAATQLANTILRIDDVLIAKTLDKKPHESID